MGNDTAIEPAEEPVIEATEVVEGTPIENGGEATPEVVEVEDNEVILEGNEGSQPDISAIVRKRVNTLNARNKNTLAELSDNNQKLAAVENENKILRMAQEQRNLSAAPTTPPDPDAFDDGVKDPKYVEALNTYQLPFIQAEIKRQQTSDLSQQQTDSANSNLVKMQTKHYERAEALGIKTETFDEVEGKAVDVLGTELSNEIIKLSPESELVLFYFGKNQTKAEEFRDLAKKDPAAALMKIGALGANLKVKPKAKTEPTPDPDEELQGGSPSAAQSNKFQRLIDKARDAAANGGNMQAIMKLKKEAAAAGVTIT